MIKPLVKICGITNISDALICTGAGVNYLGFIFFEKSKRFVEPSKAREIIKNLPQSVTPVGVFVNAGRDLISKIIAQTGIRLLQLSGDETPEESHNYTIPVWKAFRFKPDDSIDIVERYDVSAILLDGVKNGEYGGTGTPVDFLVALKIKEKKPLVLAGGLNPDNICEAITTVQPYVVDVNSGIEHVPGKKDHAKIQLLFEQISNIVN